jgi:tetratricopeptide (TPR) repeat protein
MCAVPSVSDASKTFDLGLEAAYAGDMEAAARHWTKEIRTYGGSYAAYANRGTALLRSGHVLQGIRDWYRAKPLAPNFAYGLCSGDFIRQAPRNRRNLNFVRPLELDPEYVASVSMMGITFLDLGMKKHALELYRKSLELTRNPMLKSRFDHWIKSIEGRRE